MTHEAIDDAILDHEWLAGPGRRSRTRVLLVVLFAAMLGFLAGTLVQKHLGTSADDAAASPLAAGNGPDAGGVPQGLPADLANGGGLPDAPGDVSGAQPSDGTESSSEGAAQAVIGTVVTIRGDTWIVEDLGGSRHRITIGPDTRVIRGGHLVADGGVGRHRRHHRQRDR